MILKPAVISLLDFLALVSRSILFAHILLSFFTYLASHMFNRFISSFAEALAQCQLCLASNSVVLPSKKNLRRSC